MSDLLSLLFFKKRPWATRSHPLFKKEQHVWLSLDLSKSLSKMNELLKKSLFSFVFDSFSLPFPFLMPKFELLMSLFAQSLFTKEWPWANSSRCSLQKSYRLWAICSRRSLQKSNGSESLFCSQNHAIRSKNQRANSQPCNLYTLWTIQLAHQLFTQHCKITS